MATIGQIIQRVDETKPNAFSAEVKLGWLAELEGKLAANVFLMGVEEVRQLQYRFPDSMETEPLVSFPHDGIYVLWLGAMIDYANGEYDKYHNAMELFNAHYNDFVCWFASVYDPAQGYRRN